MSAKSDESTGYCCCAVVVVAVVVTVVGWIADFVGQHPGWTALIVLAAVTLTVVLVVDKSREHSPDATPDSDVTTTHSAWSSQAPRIAQPTFQAHERTPPATTIASRESGQRQFDEAERSQDAHDTEAIERTPAPDGAPIDPDRPAAIASNTDDAPPRGEHAGGLEAFPLLDDEKRRPPEPVLAPDTLWATVKALLRRDRWAILGASRASARGGIDIIAAKGERIIAVQCHAPATYAVLDASVAQRLLAAPFDIHRIEEIVLVSSVPVSDTGRTSAESHDVRIHVIDDSELLAWGRGERHLEPMWGLITPAAQ